MKRSQVVLRNIFLTGCILFAGKLSFAQTRSDTIKTPKPNDPMVIDPGKVNDPMAAKPTHPSNDAKERMAILSDTAFLAKNIRDNREEIRLATLGQEKGTSAAVKKVAASIKLDHTAILNELLKIAKTQPAVSGATGSPGDAAEDLTEGLNFDQEWAGHMLHMHEQKIVELERFLSLTKNAALRAAVLKAIPKIKTHRDMLLRIPGAKDKAIPTRTI